MTTQPLDWYLTNGARVTNECYRADDMLRREPDPVGLYNWLYHMREEGWSVEQVKAVIQQSPEWHAIHDVKPLPPVPTREQVCGVRLTFQGLTVNGVNWFEPWIQAVGVDRQTVYTTKHAAGDTHCIVEFMRGKPIYNESPFDRFVSPDFEADPHAFRALVEEIVREGFTPIVAFDGDNADNPIDGYPNASRQLPILAELFTQAPDLTPYILFARLWDGVFYGSSPVNIANFGREFRRLLPSGYLAIEHNPGHIPVGDGDANWRDGGAMTTYDVLFHEFQNWPVHGDDAWQIAARVLGPAYRRPPDQPAEDDPRPPWYWAQGSPRGPYYACAFEYAEYDWVRGRISAADIQTARAYFRRLGYAYTG